MPMPQAQMPMPMGGEQTNQAPMPQQQAPQPIAKGPNLFDMWARDEDGQYADLTDNDIDILMKEIQAKPQIGQGIWQNVQKANGQSMGDFRKDALAGMAQMITLLQKGPQ